MQTANLNTLASVTGIAIEVASLVKATRRARHGNAKPLDPIYAAVSGWAIVNHVTYLARHYQDTTNR